MNVELPKTKLKDVLNGILYTIKNEFSMKLILLLWFAMLVCSYVLCFNTLEIAIILMLLGLITATELINTSIEAVVDLASPNIHPIAKVAKDTASCATGIFSVTAIICFILITLKNLMEVGIL